MGNKYGKFLTVILVVAMVAIVALLGFFGFDTYMKYYRQKQSDTMINQFEDQIRDNGNDENDNENTNTIDNTNTTSEDGEDPFDKIQGANIVSGGSGSSSSSKTVKWGDDVVIGTIEIPATGLKSTILDRISKTSLEKAIVLVYPTTAPDGEPLLNQRKNTTLAGHNYRNGTLFSNNNKLKEGDVIYITDLSGRKITYSVYQIQELPENDSTYLNRDTHGAREISLSTCTENAATRLVIFAKEK